MNAERDVIRELRAWLHAERDEDADRVIDSVLDQIDWVPQRRPGRLARSLRIMNDTRFRFGIAAAAIVVATFLGLRFLPSDVGGPPPEPIPETAFTSERHHYTLLFPDDTWQIVERAGSWDPGTAFSESSAGLDVADQVGTSEPWVLLTSQPLDIDAEAWLERYDQLNEEAFTHCSLASSGSRVVDAVVARINRYACDGMSDGVEAVMFHTDRAYVIRVFHPDDPAYDPRPLLDEFLDIFRFAD